MKTKPLLSECEGAALLKKYPTLPKGYIDYLLNVGAGEAPSGRMIYSRPIQPNDVYPGRVFEKRLILLGDDMMGYCLALDPVSGALGELSPRGEWHEWPSTVGFDSYVAASDEI